VLPGEPCEPQDDVEELATNELSDPTAVESDYIEEVPSSGSSSIICHIKTVMPNQPPNTKRKLPDTEL
jgi:hypothetical protein